MDAMNIFKKIALLGMTKRIKYPVPYLRLIQKINIVWDKLIWLPNNCKIHRYSVKNIKVESIQCENIAPDNTIIYIHGGAFILGLNNFYRTFAYFLSKKCKARVILIDYDLAPQAPYPIALNQLLMVYLELLKTIPSKNLIIAGDSAGGNLAVSLMILIKEFLLPLPVCSFILSGWFDLTLQTATKAKNNDPLITVDHLRQVRDAYLQGVIPNWYLASPLYGDIRGFPPIFIHVGKNEILLNDSYEFAKKAQSNYIDVQYEVHPDMVHVHPILFPRDTSSQEVMRDISQFISQHTK